MKKYPYIQDKLKINDGVCERCGSEESLFLIEWRVDIFQGNCEYEKVCSVCLNKEKQEEEKKAFKEYKKLEKHREEVIEPRYNKFKKLLEENNIKYIKYNNTGQWCFNDIIDWWSTTGTAIHRKSKKRFNFNIKNPNKIIEIIINNKDRKI